MLESPNPHDRIVNRSRSNTGNKFKHGNYSEGEQSDEDEVEVISTGKRSNLTNTSVHIIKNDDVSSQASGLSGNFAYLNSQAM